MHDGSLYANNDRIFPPSKSMSLQASRYETADKTQFDEKVQLYYSLDARPLNAHEAPMGIVRINVDLFDQQGDPVTPNTVVLDLLDHPDGSLRIAKIRIEPGKIRPEGTPENGRQWQMKFWQSEMGTFLKQSSKKDKQTSSTSTATSDSKTTIAHGDQSKSKDVANPESSSEVDSESDSDSTVGYIFSPYFAPASYSSSHRSHRHSHDRDSKNLSAFMRLIRPVILPAVLGAAAGLIACLVGFVIGHIFMSLSLRLGLRKERDGERRVHRRAKTVQIEDGIVSEKADLIPKILVTEIEDSEPEV